jgi:hypothetical protein
MSKVNGSGNVMPRKLGPTSGATDGDSEEAVQQEPFDCAQDRLRRDDGATSGSDALRCPNH